MRRTLPAGIYAPSGRDFDRALRESGARPTRHRRAIYAALAGCFDHPTAETLHRRVRRRLKGLSLATVYTSLEALAAAGLVGRVVGPDGVAHYDARIDHHDHRRCLACGRIDDLERPPEKERLTSYQTPEFRATRYHVEVVGYCAGCLAAGAPSRSPGPERLAGTPQGESR